METSLPHESERPYRETLKSNHYNTRINFGLPVINADTDEGSSYSLMKHMLSEMEESVYGRRRTYTDKDFYRITDINSLNQIISEMDSIHSFKWAQLENNGIYGNYAIRKETVTQRFPAESYETVSLVALDRTVRDAYQLKDYMEDLFNEVKEYTLSNARVTKLCPVCHKKLTMFGKCPLGKCPNSGKKLYGRDGSPNMKASIPKYTFTP